MTEEAAKRAVWLTLWRSGQPEEPVVLAEATGFGLDTVMWALDRLRDEEKVRCRVGAGREWWEAL
jgi:hypothetical protein